MKDRIKQIMDEQHMTQQEFSEFLNIAPATLSSILRGRTRPTLAIVDAIVGRLPDISTDWLLFGKGAMKKLITPAEAPVSDSNVHESSLASCQNGAVGVCVQPDVLDLSSTRIGMQMHLPGMGANEQTNVVKKIDKQQRRITEIRIFYDDQTWETFVPKK